MSISAKFITVEGIDGAGKSSACQFIKEYLAEKTNKLVKVVEQNRKHPVGLMVRNFIGSESARYASPNVFLYLFLAGIQETIEKEIIPSLKNDEFVISDRFLLSTRVYQNDAYNVDTVCDKIEEDFVRPDFTFILDINPTTALDRINLRNQNGDVFETSDLDTLEERRANFLRLERNPETHFIIIDANQDFESVKEQIKYNIDLHVLKTIRVIDKEINKDKTVEDVYNLLFKM